MNIYTAVGGSHIGTGGSTALHFAAANGHIDVLTLLLRCGADLSKVDKHGVTPLMLAERLGRVSHFRVLSIAPISRLDIGNRPRQPPLYAHGQKRTPNQIRILHRMAQTTVSMPNVLSKHFCAVHGLAVESTSAVSAKTLARSI
ncbi:Ank domain-containing protein [Rhizoctonia solani AG-1 IA]|uniref:Ank domain-containing protein n=1 Tax=Thanatephorus cucumeris (strain AG1-IA) TaxID=983506 RepID=L8WWW4_THACA|nr:Ank domain-containing protein [Rhizoctonia solani AG-1 IA]